MNEDSATKVILKIIAVLLILGLVALLGLWIYGPDLTVYVGLTW